ncbi:arylsulfatase [Sphingobium sp. OAS761]|uniref:arylsulfatase n=1 Tax=Sphingobium sp. OAS761 TaxID=2817901 RepID=UPI0020A0826B|nr:arylsulfatase [Sphingobium sp. OAS761]MCP1471713.1 arylsulfatase [Sphingobium sp. OAS761]
MRRLALVSTLTVAAGFMLSAPATADAADEAPAPLTAPTPAAAPVQTRPNVLIWMIDDVGFGQLSGFGGLVPTPNIERVAHMGLRYDNYRTAPMCSPARASLLTGRMPHSVHMGGHPLQAFPFPGYDGKVPAEAGTIAENLRQAGYRTYAVGKWDHLPPSEASPAGPLTHWPLQQGFERYYGFLSADTDNFFPTLVRDNSAISAPIKPGYHLSADMADQAIAMLTDRDGSDADEPFFLYWATGAAHAPHHAPQAWINRFKGQFDMGWDRARETILAREIKAGLIPEGSKLAPLPDAVPAWDSLDADHKRLYARQMEAFAASLSYADAQFGRILDALSARGELDNTIIIITTDNGASAEGGPGGALTESYIGNATPPAFSDNLAMIDKWGGPDTYPHYSLGWAVAGDTPFRYWKQTAHDGGIHVPLVMAWPRGIPARGELRHQFVHVSDIAPTVLDLAKAPLADTVNDVKQAPMEGLSFAATFAAPGDRRQGEGRYAELYGNKSFWQDGWTIVTSHRLKTWDSAVNTGQPFDDPWQLYDTVRDPGQTTDLAAEYPDRVKSMAAAWQQQAQQHRVFPQHNIGDDTPEQSAGFVAALKSRNGKWRYPGPVSNLYFSSAPPVNLMPFTATIRLDLSSTNETGPVFAYGGRVPGMALYLDQGRPVFLFNEITGAQHRIEGSELLPKGANRLELRLRTAGKADTQNRSDWTVAITANGKQVAQDVLHIEMPRMMGISATFDVGNDTGSPVMSGYPAGTPLNATIKEMTFDFFAK